MTEKSIRTLAEAEAFAKELRQAGRKIYGIIRYGGGYAVDTDKGLRLTLPRQGGKKGKAMSD